VFVTHVDPAGVDGQGWRSDIAPGFSYAHRMEARKISVWRSRYSVTEQGREITVWDSSVWKSGGEFALDGRRFQVRSSAWGSKYAMVDDVGAVVASAGRVGRKRWTVEAAGQTYQFRRKSFWGNEEELVLGDTRVGSVRKTSFWRGDVAVELPGLATALQIFVLGVVIRMWDSQAAAAAAGG
jgi:hypothetical protein